MKRFILCIMFTFLTATAAFADMASVDITAENQWTVAITVKDAGIIAIDDTGSMSMTFTLQISVDGGTTWSDTGDTWTAEGVDTIADGCDMMFRLGVKTGGFTSGTATGYIISQKR